MLTGFVADKGCGEYGHTDELVENVQNNCHTAMDTLHVSISVFYFIQLL